jgi:hypothetical protein
MYTYKKKKTFLTFMIDNITKLGIIYKMYSFYNKSWYSNTTQSQN